MYSVDIAYDELGGV